MRRLLLLLLLVLLLAAWFWLEWRDRGPIVPSGPFACTVAAVPDGDSLRCREAAPGGGTLRVRLSGIAAREPDGTCRPGHPCPAATGEAARAVLARLAAGRRLACRPVGVSYDRVAAFCRRPDGMDLSCAMVATGTAARWDRHWGNHRCPPSSEDIS